jgi:hypothetical protein
MGCAQLLLIQHHIMAFRMFEGLDDVLPWNFLASLGIDPLIADGLAVAPIEHAEMQVDTAFA